jgi:hypothetical protein
VSAGGVVTEVVSFTSSVLAPPPQATNANAKAHTSANAISFFIVFLTGFNMGAKIRY